MNEERIQEAIALCVRAVEIAVDAALGEIRRQIGSIDPQILKEARTEGVCAAAVPLCDVAKELY